MTMFRPAVLNLDFMEDFRPCLGKWEKWPQKSGKYCSHCCSMHPEKFLEMARDGMELGATDKGYKVYVHTPGVFNKFYFYHLSVDQMKEFVQLHNDRKLNAITHRPRI